MLSVGVDDGELRIEVGTSVGAQPRGRGGPICGHGGVAVSGGLASVRAVGVTEFADGKSVWAVLLVVVGTARPPSGWL